MHLAMTFRTKVAFFCVTACLFLSMISGTTISASVGQEPQAGYQTTQNLQLGERIYRDGILPSGEPLQAVIKGDIPVVGTSFSCVSCHLRSGLGSFEGGVITPPTDGNSLYQPFNLNFKKVAADTRYFPPTQHRPAYSDETLAAALRGGVDPAGHVMNPVMPRYLLEDKDMKLLIAYLKTLSSRLPSGVSDTSINFATVITDDVPVEEYEAMLAPLDLYIRQKNNMIDLYKRQKRSERMAAVMLESGELLYKKFTLSRWILKGPPRTWRSQLEEYHRKDPAFVLLGGISRSDWQPIHDFCEEHQLPNLFPQTMFPVISETSWYTLYLSKGHYQEGEAAARYLNMSKESGKVVQIVQSSPEGRALARGFKETWQETGHPEVTTVVMDQSDETSEKVLRELILRERPSALAVWAGDSTLQTLQHLASIEDSPRFIFVSVTSLGKEMVSVPEKIRTATYITYPFRLPAAEARYNFYIAPFKGNTGRLPTDIFLKQSYDTTILLTAALMDMRGKYFRDNFLDVIGMMRDQDLPLYERLSFGPGQRYASKGCYIVQIGAGTGAEMIRKSDWVIH